MGRREMGLRKFGRALTGWELLPSSISTAALAANGPHLSDIGRGKRAPLFYTPPWTPFLSILRRIHHAFDAQCQPITNRSPISSEISNSSLRVTAATSVPDLPSWTARPAAMLPAEAETGSTIEPPSFENSSPSSFQTRNSCCTYNVPMHMLASQSTRFPIGPSTRAFTGTSLLTCSQTPASFLPSTVRESFNLSSSQSSHTKYCPSQHQGVLQTAVPCLPSPFSSAATHGEPLAPPSSWNRRRRLSTAHSIHLGPRSGDPGELYSYLGPPQRIMLHTLPCRQEQAVRGANASDAGPKGAPNGAGSGMRSGVHVFQCLDHSGIVAKISECIAANRANLLNIDLFVDLEATPAPIFYSRSEFSFDPSLWPRAQMEDDFSSLGAQMHAVRSSVHVLGQDPPLKAAILASKQDHCLVDLLHRWQDGLLPIDITCIISNHERGPNTHVSRFLERHGIPYHCLPTAGAQDKREADILDLVRAPLTDFLVLARYMQVLSPRFLVEYGNDIINIHHGLLPSFKGAKPYLQAYRAGVKLIGATSHFVTPQLDEGPIIEQLVDRVSHRDTLASLAGRSKILEQQCLSEAVKCYAERRILKYSENKTIVFKL